jgi:hypothetical protein
MTEYFKNKTGGECFICSLANLLLVQFDDRKTAEFIYHNAKNHPFVFEDGIYALDWPRITSDLSRGKYEGTLYVPPSALDELGKLEELVSPGKNPVLYKKAIEESLRLGWIRSVDRYNGCYPVILAIYGWEESHAVVVLNRKKLIDDGFVKEINMNKLKSQGYSLDGMFQMTKLL